jgi:hypothetical protein
MPRVVVLLAALVGLASASPARADLTNEIAFLIDSKVNGGESGFLLRQIDGPVLAADEVDHVFYPASSIKVLLHLHAMLEVEAGNSSLDTTALPVYEQPGESCNDDHSNDTMTARNLRDVLRRMMEQSNNDDTNAVYEWYTRPAINDTAHDIVGMSPDAQLNHKFGCGGPTNDPANRMALLDLLLLYERVARGEIFAVDDNRDDFYELMLDDTDNTNLEQRLYGLIVEEGLPLGLDDFETWDAIAAEMDFAWKGGSFSGPSIGDYRSLAGWIRLPAHSCSTMPAREYVWGIFFDNATTISPNFSTTDVFIELIRGEMRTALEDWAACASCGEAGAGPCNIPHGDVGCDDAACCEAVCAINPLCCDPDFGWDASCASLAVALCDFTPNEDDCVAAPALYNCQVRSFDISNATSDGPTHLVECNWDASLTKDIWYEYTATGTGILTIEVCSDDEAGDPTDPFDLWVGVYADCICGAVQQASLLDCNVGTAACGQGGTLLGVPVTEGQCYKIRVAAGIPSLGTGKISLSCSVENDRSADATELGALIGLVTFSTASATTDGPAHRSCGFVGDDQVHNDVWFAWTAPCTGQVFLRTCGAADFDTRLAVYAGTTPTEASLLGCNDDAQGCASFGSQLAVPVGAGKRYLIRVGGFNGAAGNGALDITCIGGISPVRRPGV